MNNQTVQLFESKVLKHPFTPYFMEGKKLTALKMSDFYSLNQFKKRNFTKEFVATLALMRL
jgi:hypothetical protein